VPGSGPGGTATDIRAYPEDRPVGSEGCPVCGGRPLLCVLALHACCLAWRSAWLHTRYSSARPACRLRVARRKSTVCQRPVARVRPCLPAQIRPDCGGDRTFRSCRSSMAVTASSAGTRTAAFGHPSDPPEGPLSAQRRIRSRGHQRPIGEHAATHRRAREAFLNRPEARGV